MWLVQLQSLSHHQTAFAPFWTQPFHCQCVTIDPNRVDGAEEKGDTRPYAADHFGMHQSLLGSSRPSFRHLHAFQFFNGCGGCWGTNDSKTIQNLLVWYRTLWHVDSDLLVSFGQSFLVPRLPCSEANSWKAKCQPIEELKTWGLAFSVLKWPCHAPHQKKIDPTLVMPEILVKYDQRSPKRQKRWGMIPSKILAIPGHSMKDIEKPVH